MIEFDQVSIRYTPTGPLVLRQVSLEVGEGQLVLVAGRTGTGKSTLLGAINGHVPHFTGGTLTGRVRVGGLDTATHPPRELAHVVGVVGQDPSAGFVTDTVEEELAYGMEQLGLAPAAMRVRVEETMDILGLADLRRRALRTLSGGQQQRVAIGSVLATGVRVLVLDEPTSALDPVSAEEVLACVLRLVDDIALTVVVAEHRLERVVGLADRMILLDGQGGVSAGPTASIMALSPLRPPVVELGQLAGWDEVALTVRQARRAGDGLRDRLAGLNPGQFARQDAPVPARPPDGATQLVTRDLTVSFGRQVAVDRVSAHLAGGQITVVMGRNGSGKSSLFWALAGVQPLAGGRFEIDGRRLDGLGPDKVRDLVRLVPQTASDLLYLASVGQECAAADREGGQPGATRAILDQLAPGIDQQTHPQDLSEGQKLCLVLAIQLAAGPAVILLDEPTRGLDYPAKSALARLLSGLAGQGRAVGVVTHDVEFAAQVADQILVLAGGEVIHAADAATVLGSSALFAPQVAKVLHPAGWLTPYQVGCGLQAGRKGRP
jgi:energy-coupling factor transport system ATP-binding protein